jgi:glycosyltransferase involved in cell wall biosynthesis
LGFSDIPIPVKYPIHYYTQLKDHSQCCKKGMVIEHTAPDNPTVKFLLPGIIGSSVPEHQDKNVCIKGQNLMQDHYGFDSAYFVIQHFRPDIVMPINDIWGLYNINHLKNRHCFKFVPYLAIDSDCLFPALVPPESRPGLPAIDSIRTIGSANKVVVFTNWAKEVINKTCRIVTGGKELSNIEVIPHGVDSNVWKPLDPETKKLAREKYFGFGDNVFLIGVVARNQPRKRLDGILMMMKKFIDSGHEKNGKKIMCYFHSSLDDQNIGWDLKWLSAYYGVSDRVIFDKNLKPGMGPSEEQLNEIVNCFDVHCLFSNSEGWGLPIIETAAAGIPNLVSKYSAHADWGKEALMFCKIGAYEHEPRTNFVKGIVDTDHAAHQLNLLYSSKELRKDYSKKGVALGKKLDWSNIQPMWEKIFNDIDTSDLKENRYDDPSALPEVQQQQQQPNFSQLNLSYFPE